MSITEHIMQKVQRLSSDDQQKVIDFLDALLAEAAAISLGPRKNPKGMFADLGIHITAEDIAEARAEMWGNFPRDLPDPTKDERS